MTAPFSPDVTETAADHRFPCESCGGKMRFDPARGLLVCDHCGNEEPMEDRAGPWGGSSTIREQDFEDALRDRLAEADMEETQVFACNSCGAHVEFDPGIHAGVCPFCAAPIVGVAGTNRHIKPQGVVPFAVNEDAARAAMVKWLGRLWFAPNGLQQYARKGRKMEGIYTPYWTFDARTRSRYTGQRGDIYYETRRTGKGETQTVAKVRWHARRGQVARNFDDVLVPGSHTLPPPVLEALPPWDLSRLVPYAPQYLAGMRSEAYRIELDVAFDDARGRMDRVIERDVRFDIGGDRQRIHDVDTDISDVTFKHILLPVWVAVYRYRGEVFQVLINGQSGRVQGDRPYSRWKIAIAVILAAIGALTLAYLAALSESSGAGY